MKRYFTVILFPFLLYPIYSQNNWVDQTNNGLGSNYSRSPSLDAIDSLNAVTGGSGSKIYTTKDGGMHWLSKDFSNTLGDSTSQTIDVSIPAENKIWIGTSDGMILRTNDGGDNWQLQFYDTTITKFINYIEMFDTSNGIAMGDPTGTGIQTAVLLKTINGGTRWDTLGIYVYGAILEEWRRIDFVDMNTGYFFKSGVNAQPYCLYKTTNGGISWDTTNYSQVSNYVWNLKFYNENIGFALDWETLYRSKDGGKTWDTTMTFNAGVDGNINFIKNGNSFIVVFLRDNNIYFSADTGKTWISDTTFNKSGNIPYKICFPDARHAWLIRGGGGIVNEMYYKSYDYGTITELNETDLTPTSFYLSQNYPNPFNPSTKIRYTIPHRELVTIKIFDMLGREVSNLINEVQNAGQHEINFNAENLPSGIYFYRIAAGSSTIVKKMVLLK